MLIPDFLNQQHPKCHTGSQGVLAFSDIDTELAYVTRAPSVCPLLHLSALTVSGPDAEKLLQGQLTCDIRAAESTRAMTGAYCDRKGRVVCSFYVVKHNDQYDLIMPSSMIDTALCTLQKYAVFSKVSLSARKNTLIGTVNSAPSLDAALFEAAIDEHRHIAALEADHFENSWKTLTKSHQAIGYNAWRYLDIQSKWVFVEPNSSLQFLPQMLGLDEIGSISFTKGCYIGQEIIARATHRGKVKKKLHLVYTDCKVAIGDSLTTDMNARVVSIAATDGRWIALVVKTTE